MLCSAAAWHGTLRRTAGVWPPNMRRRVRAYARLPRPPGVEELRQRRVRVVITSVLGPVRHQLDRYGISDIVGPGAYYDTPGAALEAYHAARPDADQD